MKKFLSIFLILVVCLSCSSLAFAADLYTSVDVSISTTNADDISTLAAQHLKTMKEQLGNSCRELGFDTDTFLNMSTGTPFTVYSFDEFGKVLSDDVYLCPLIHENTIVGTIGIYYDTTSSSYCYSMGKSYATQLNELVHSTQLDKSSTIVIGHIDDKLFATDGTNVTILFEEPTESNASVDINTIKNICGTAKSNVGSLYSSITSITSTPTTFKTTSTSVQPQLLSNPLPVPHVAQGSGVCGIAAWAAVLNYRFDTTYTTPTLTTAMKDGSYTNGTGGNPNMTDYKNFANDTHNAGCVFKSSPPTFSQVTSAIGAGKPIMGSWYSGTGSDKVYHAIIITGYIKNSSNYTYYVKNPWYQDAVTITVSSASNVVYVDGSYT